MRPPWIYACTRVAHAIRNRHLSCQDGYQDDHNAAIGIVLEVKASGWCKVQWSTGIQETYRTGADGGMYDVIPFDKTVWEIEHPPPLPPVLHKARNPKL